MSKRRIGLGLTFASLIACGSSVDLVGGAGASGSGAGGVTVGADGVDAATTSVATSSTGSAIGAGGSGGGGGGGEGETGGYPAAMVGTEVVSFGGSDWASSIAVDATTIYWTRISQDGQPGAIESCAISGCGLQPTVVVPNLSREIGSIAVDAQNLYWVDIGANYDAGAVFKCPKFDCANHVTTLASGLASPSHLAVDATSLYWVNVGDDADNDHAAVLECSISGCPAGPSIIAEIGAGPERALSIDSANIYWVDDQQVLACPKTGCAGGPKVLASQQPGVSSVASDGNSVFWGSSPDDSHFGPIVSCGVMGCANSPTEILAKDREPTLMLVDDSNVYWTDTPTDVTAMETCPKTGCQGAPKTLMNIEILAMTMDAKNLYWSQQAGGQYNMIRMLAK